MQGLGKASSHIVDKNMPTVEGGRCEHASFVVHIMCEPQAAETVLAMV